MDVDKLETDGYTTEVSTYIGKKRTDRSQTAMKWNVNPLELEIIFGLRLRAISNGSKYYLRLEC